MSETIAEPSLAQQSCEDCTPVIFILGFLNSKEEHFAPLKDYYSQFTPDIVTHVPRMYDQHFWMTGDNGHNFIYNIYLPKVAQKPNAPVIFHIFSQNGGYLFYYLWDALNETQRKQIKGFAIDGAPAYASCNPRYYINQRFYMWPRSEKTDHKFYLKCIPEHIPRAALYTFLYFFGYFDQYAPKMAKFDLPQNQLYLCTKDDKLVKFDYIRDFVLSQLDKGKSVTLKAWDDGVHCAHFKTHQGEYFDLCGEFVKRSLGERLYKCHVKAKL
ncbi:unnamed protein product [Bursaphelenchus xylophilus]|uniref:(pine wood nematode) hypothetical protein n=1 Tax=Bursaphelenchus xylophilus TaxID=6326 RepID=A0A1I7RYU2_BURXY|nr:unnamed protein product [Bursaphelenchus xylophilus]CAG9092221.1 unnamed protein product [Bursaphelenchus xylophilus]